MQSDYHQIYKLTAKRTGKPEEQYKNIGQFVFSELSSMLKKPKSLITKLKGVGSWYLRKKRIKLLTETFPPDYDRTRESFPSENSFLKNEEKKEFHTLLRQRMIEYEQYSKEKQEIRKQRNVTSETLLETPDEEGGEE